MTGELDPDAERAPLVVLHGGPGVAHNYTRHRTSHVGGGGAYDGAQPEAWQPFVDRIPDVISHVFAGSSHIPQLEEPEEFRRVGDFLRRHD